MNKIDKKESSEGLSEVDKFKLFLKQFFPNMNHFVIEKNVNFTIMLEDYTGTNFHGMEKFLDDKNYSLEGFKYIDTSSGGNIQITKDQEKNIINGKYNVGLKIFYRKRGENVKSSLYFIIAKKKNILSLDWVSDKVENLILNKFII